MKLVIDLFSKGWVHKDFNIQFISEYTDKKDLIVGNKNASYFNNIPSRESLEIDGNVDYFKLIKYIVSSDEVTFLVLLNKYFILVLFCMLLGKKTSYVVHKYNLSTRKRRKFTNGLYTMFEKFGLSSLSFEEADKCFSNNSVINLDMWKETKKSKVKDFGAIRNIAFIGKPVAGKNFDLLIELKARYGFNIYIYCDQDIDEPNCIIRPFQENIEDCDVIWGYYDPGFYKGIQSGLCYPSLTSGLKVITNECLGFIYFASIYSENIINCRSICELNSILGNEE
ncbi:hypothetical protein A136_13980 [Vibrio crassostreae 9ZC13]|uniref:hypothetical protein n=1 Tax=Vibrio crassostreae TaxID=246167 RepID=UPI000316D029|nr:hypothetical protein [Vibrio crassostreae]OEF00503.1 hypothetical protein A136_13980 [Vibrio crassostreae 9ZC13]